jgi:hypothetical protein
LHYFRDDLLTEDYAWLIPSTKRTRGSLPPSRLRIVDDSGMLTDWWGYCWMILASAGCLSGEPRRGARGD